MSSAEDKLYTLKEKYINLAKLTLEINKAKEISKSQYNEILDTLFKYLENLKRYYEMKKLADSESIEDLFILITIYLGLKNRNMVLNLIAENDFEKYKNISYTLEEKEYLQGLLSLEIEENIKIKIKKILGNEE